MYLIDIDIKNTSIFIVSFVSFVYGFVVYSQNPRNKSNIFFFLMVIAITFWSISMAVFRSVDDDSSLWARLLYASASGIPFCFLFFAFYFPKKEKDIKMPNKILLFFLVILMLLTSLIPGFLVEGVNAMKGSENEIIFNSFSYFIYIVYFSIYFTLSYFILFKKYLKAKGILKEQIKYIMLGTLAAVGVGTVTNLIMPFLGLFYLNWLGQVSVIFMVLSVAYAISKYQLFDIKVILTEVLIFSVGVILIMRLFFVNSVIDFTVNSITIILVIVLGYFLIKSVKNEVKRREETEALANELKKANKKLKEIDEAKSDFISIASHQLRTPLTAIKGYTSMILDGTYGKSPEKISVVIDRIFQSSQRLVIIVNDLLNVSRIEQGRIKYDLSNVDVVSMIKDIKEEFMPRVKRKKLEIILNFSNDEIVILADEGKLRQAFTNIIDNSIKYTNEGYVKIEISLDEPRKNILINIKDSGIGIDKESIGKIFEKFTRAKDAIKSHTEGSGIGLYVAREIIRAHGGDVKVRSEGEGKGTQFFITLPVKN